jgi:hypothetical protein
VLAPKATDVGRERHCVDIPHVNASGRSYDVNVLACQLPRKETILDKNMTTQKYLDLTALQPGDVLLTSERTFTSRAIVLAQRFWHWRLLGRGFSHATVVISPLLTFDTRGGAGARFRRRHATEISEDDQGRLQLWLELSEYKDVAVMRYGSDIDSHLLLKAAIAENTAPYPHVNAFLGLFHPSIKSAWSRMVRRQRPGSDDGPQKFCSSLVAFLLQKINASEYFRKTDWSAISPFKLHNATDQKAGIVVERARDSFSTSPIHRILLLQAQAEAGANSFTDMDDFQHGSEDVIKAVANSSLLRPSLAQDPDYFIDVNGERISLFDRPHYAQLPSLRRQIDSNARMLNRFKSMSACFADCKEPCANAASCLRGV